MPPIRRKLWRKGEKQRINITPYNLEQQKKKRLEERKVRKGETLDQWARRMRRKNIVPEEQIIRKLKTKKYVLEKARAETARAEKKKEFNHIKIDCYGYHNLKYYGVISTYVCVKFDVRKEDLEILMMFYNNVIFDRDRFNNMVLMTTTSGTHTSQWKRFNDKKYITKILIKGVHKGDYRISKTGRFPVTRVYEILYGGTFSASMRNYNAEIHFHTTLAKKELENMYAEMEAYRTGDIPQLEIPNE